MVAGSAVFILALLFTNVSSFSNDACLSYTASGSCCTKEAPNSSQACNMERWWYRCIGTDGVKSNCAFSSLPGAKYGYPFGMLNGLISSLQLLVPSNKYSAWKARLLWHPWPNGWSPETDYLVSHSANIDYLKTINSFPNYVYHIAPVFYEITFLRLLRVFYFLVGHANGVPNELHQFIMSYRDIDGSRNRYGESSGYPQVFACTMGHCHTDCRFSVTPFRGRSLRLVDVSYRRNAERKLFLEAGGLDYTEADHQWTLDNKNITGSYFPDKIGSKHLTTVLSAEGLYEEATAKFPTLHCFAHPFVCKDGLSVAFWLKAGSDMLPIITSGNGWNTTNTGFKVIFHPPKTLIVDIIFKDAHFPLTYSLTSNGWVHFAITWSTTSGISLFENGVLVINGSRNLHSTTDGNIGEIKVFIAMSSTGTQLHDLRIWSYKLYSFDVANIYSPVSTRPQRETKGMRFNVLLGLNPLNYIPEGGRYDNPYTFFTRIPVQKFSKKEHIPVSTTGSGRKEEVVDIKRKFRPRNCLEAFAAYGRVEGVYEIYTNIGSYPLKCIPVENGAKFHFFPDVPVFKVIGPWTKSYFKAVIQYDYDLSSMKNLFESATWCQQKISYECQQAAITGKVFIWDGNLYGWNKICDGDACNCDAADNLKRNDVQTFYVRSRLPLRMIQTKVDSSMKYQKISVNPVECYSVMQVYSSCKDALDSNGLKEGTYIISTKRKNISVVCQHVNGEFKTVMHHKDSGVPIHVQGYEAQGSYAKQIEYLEDFGSIVAVVDSSDRCQQSIVHSCKNSLLTHNDWFTDRRNNKLNFYAGGEEDGVGCKCFRTKSCADSSKKCNCDKNDNVERSDSGVYSRKSDLPLTSFRAGETGSPNEELTVTIGSVECFGDRSAGSNNFSNANDNTSNQNEESCKNEMYENACCKFPFTYMGETYNNCSIANSRIPWCSLTSNYTGRWRYCLSAVPKADIDFSLGPKETTGDWKIGNDCSNEENSGPCYDMTLSSKPSEKMVAILRFTYLRISTFSTYDKKTSSCINNHFEGSISRGLTAMSISVYDLSSIPQFIQSTEFKLSKNLVINSQAIVHIYAAVPFRQDNEKFMRQCNFTNFRSEIFYGPVIWKVGPSSATAQLTLPDLKSIIIPALRSKDPVQERIYLVFEWKEFLKGTSIQNWGSHIPKYMTLRHFGKEPGNYLYADSLDAKEPGRALIYNTKYFPPSKKCLQFWYYMEGVGDSMLTVNLYQNKETAREVLRIKGNQGKKWKKALVPIGPYLNELGQLAKVSFVAIRGTKISRSIAIDDISFLAESCSLQPQLLHEKSDGLPKAELLIALDNSLTDSGLSQFSVKQTQSAKKPTEDKFAYPLLFAYFDGNSNGLVKTPPSSRMISGGFSVCFQVKYLSSNQNSIIWTHNTSLIIRVLSDDHLEIRFLTESNIVVEHHSSKAKLAANKWNFVCVIFEDHLGVLKYFVDGKLIEEIFLGFITPGIHLSNILIGSRNKKTTPLYISCVQLYAMALDDSFIPALDLCPNRHVKNACDANCTGASICNQLTGKCVCPSYADRFVKEDCSNALMSTVYNGFTDYISFDDRDQIAGKTFPSLMDFKNITEKYPTHFASIKFGFVPGPVNSAFCILKHSALDRLITAASCFLTSSCTIGSTIAFWLYVPDVPNWDVTGNVTLLAYGRIKVVYGLVDDMRNGSTKPIPSLMFNYTSASKTCLWISMIHSNLITDAWSHLALTVDSSFSLKAYYNGKLNHLTKSKCVTPATENSAFLTGGLYFTCLDEVVVWNQILNASKVEKIFNGVVFGGQQAIQSKIKFRRLMYTEPDDLWGIDESNVAYRYHEASWIPIPDLRFRAIYTGSSGTFAVVMNNTLLKRKVISPKNPIGQEWEVVRTGMFKGAIIDLMSTSDGTIYARSLYQSHCVFVSNGDGYKTLKTLVGSDGSKVNHLQLSCAYPNDQNHECWFLSQFYKDRPVTISDCRLTVAQADDNGRPGPFSRIAVSSYKTRPLAIEKSNGSLFTLIYNWVPFRPGIDIQEPSIDFVSLNLNPVEVKRGGGIEMSRKNSEPFLVRLGKNRLCWTISSNNIVLQSKCTELFMHTEDGCLYNPKFMMQLKFLPSGTELTDSCQDENKVRLNGDGSIQLLHPNAGCLLSGLAANNRVKRSSAACQYFIFEKVTSIKNIPGHNLIWDVDRVALLGKIPTTYDGADVKVDVYALFHLPLPKWKEFITHENEKPFKVLCETFSHEMKQQFYGNVNYRRFECLGLVKENCSVDVDSNNCNYKVQARLHFVHIDEGTRMVLFSRKFNGETTFCNAMLCSLFVSKNYVGVDFAPQKVEVKELTNNAVTLKSNPSWKGTQAALAGYNVSIVGYSKFRQNLRTVYIMKQHRGNVFKIKNLPSFFNFSCHFQPLFVQGAGVGGHVNFATEGDVPNEAPGVNVVDSTRHMIGMTVRQISNASWNSFALGYRIFYQSLLKMEQLPNLKNLSEVESSHEQHVNITVADYDLSMPYYLENLEVFTNYSIVIGAYNSIGLGPLTQIFFRTMQGEPEVYTPDFNVTVINSTHLHASWSPFTTNIEHLNGWYLSNYTFMYEEKSRPIITFPSKDTLILPPDQNSIIFGPLEAYREYNVSIAGNVEGRPGVFKSLCIRTDQDVPSAPPPVSTVASYGSSVVNYTTGCIDLPNENGLILYYNISATMVENNETTYYQADISEERCQSNDVCSPYLAVRCEDIGSTRNQRENHHISGNCSLDRTEMLRTSNVINFAVDNLLYWTFYDIKASACTVNGCGPFNIGNRIRTDQHSPTCAPNITWFRNSSSTSLFVKWERIPVSCAHGIVLSYNVFFSSKSELSREECFNQSSCWNQFNVTSNDTKFYKNVNDTNTTFVDLKKYHKYCVFLQAVNIKGRGTASKRKCRYTAEDAPDGPPTLFNVTVNESTSVFVKLEDPSPDLVNGIIKGFNVFYFETNENGDKIGKEMTADFNRTEGKVSTGLIPNLKEFTWYNFTARAYTSIGGGLNTTLWRRVLTLEDAPSAPPRGLDLINVTKDQFAVSVLQTEAAHLNGVFRMFKVQLTEYRRDGEEVIDLFYILPNNLTTDGSTSSSNVSAPLPLPSGILSRKRRNIFPGAPMIPPPPPPPLPPPLSLLPPVSGLVSQVINTTSEIIGSANNVTGPVINPNGAPDVPDLPMTRGIAYLNITTVRKNITNQASFDVNGDSYDLIISGLLPYTHYNISISTCTQVGCGPSVNSTVRTAQDVPSGPPEPNNQAVREKDALVVGWTEPPIMKTNGIISEYKIKWMKNCEYQRLQKSSLPNDCLRVPPENTKNFSSQEVSGELRESRITGLSPYTWYRIEICAKTLVGYGPCKNTTYQTDESVPLQPPNVTKSFDVTGKSFQVEWEDIELPYQQGIILGYIIYYQLTSRLQTMFSGNVTFDVQNTTKQPPPNLMVIGDLELRSNYSYKISAFTSKGAGANSTIFHTMTGEFKHGNWSLWSHWGHCTQSCGGGKRLRKRQCDNPAPFNGGDDCKGSSTETEVCNTDPCSGPAAGAVGQNCHQVCKGVGLFCNPKINLEDSTLMYQKLGFYCNDSKSKAAYSQGYHPSYVKDLGRCEGYKSVPSSIKCQVNPPEDGQTVRLCNCMSPNDCGCEEWTEWSVCSKLKCGGGTMKRSRACDTMTFCPSGNTSQLLDCNTTPCPVDGNWGAWSAIQACNQSCGYGFQHRYRKCDNPAAAHGGDECFGDSVDIIPGCNFQKCPVNGQWGQWVEWRVCNKPCGGGKSIRKRYCDNPEPKYYGKYCEGKDVESVPCNPHACQGVEVLFTVKLTEFVWDYKLVYSMHPKTRELAELTRQNVKAVYNHSEVIQRVKVLNFRKGSVIANFSIFYVKVSQGEVLFLQDFIGSTGKMHNLSTIVEDVKSLQVVAEPPTNLTASSYSEKTMNLTWTPPKSYNQTANIYSYYIFYREYGSDVGEWNLIGVPGLDTKSFMIQDLKPITKYRLRMTLAVTTGNGPASEEVVNSTIEGVPKVHPTKFSVESYSASMVYLQWTGISDPEFNGRPLGYAIRYKKYFDTAYTEKIVPKISWDTRIGNLKAFTLYDFDLMAVSGAGYGPPVNMVIETPEGSPSVAPPNFAVEHGISTKQIIVTWNKIPDDQVNGVLLGYKLKYTVTHVSDLQYVGAPKTKVLVLDKYTFRYKINDLQSYTTYSISISGYTNAGEGPHSKPISAKTCKCPVNVFLNWFSKPPYVVKEPGSKTSGIMFNLLEEMLKSACGKCNGVASNIQKFRSLSGESPVKKNEMGVKKAIGQEFHVSFPIFSSASITRYMEKHVFILFIKSAGSATIVKDEIDFSAKTLNAFKSIANIWPMYVLVICLTSVAGMLIWVMERKENDEFSRANYINGVLQGFWWAFISMTTVGYGDITPRTVRGRLVAIAWTLAGLVLTGILTGALTSSVTTMTMPPSISLYGSECAAVNKSFEYFLGVRRNSKMNTKRQYLSYEEVLDAVKKHEVDIALLDGFTAASLSSTLIAKSLKVTKIIDANSGYGMVLSHELVRLESDFRSYISSQQKMITSFTANMTEKLYSTKSDGVQYVPLLFDPSTKIFWDMIVVECILFGVCSVLGSLYSIYRKRIAQKKVLPFSEVQLCQMASLDNAVAAFEEGLNEKLESLGRKHVKESFELMRLQSSYKRLLKRKYGNEGEQDAEYLPEETLHQISQESIGSTEA